nr:hypothetical protein [Stenotrophomonas pavanii]
MDVEQRARELLIAQYKARGDLVAAFNIERGGLSSFYAAEIAAIVAALTPPEGYVLAPVEPTDDMLNSGLFGLEPMLHVSDIRAIYDDMLAARPEVKP